MQNCAEAYRRLAVVLERQRYGGSREATSSAHENEQLPSPSCNESTSTPSATAATELDLFLCQSLQGSPQIHRIDDAAAWRVWAAWLLWDPVPLKGFSALRSADLEPLSDEKCSSSRTSLDPNYVADHFSSDIWYGAQAFSVRDPEFGACLAARTHAAMLHRGLALPPSAGQVRIPVRIFCAPEGSCMEEHFSFVTGAASEHGIRGSFGSFSTPQAHRDEKVCNAAELADEVSPGSEELDSLGPARSLSSSSDASPLPTGLSGFLGLIKPAPRALHTWAECRAQRVARSHDAGGSTSAFLKDYLVGLHTFGILDQQTQEAARLSRSDTGRPQRFWADVLDGMPLRSGVPFPEHREWRAAAMGELFADGLADLALSFFAETLSGSGLPESTSIFGEGIGSEQHPVSVARRFQALENFLGKIPPLAAVFCARDASGPNDLCRRLQEFARLSYRLMCNRLDQLAMDVKDAVSQAALESPRRFGRLPTRKSFRREGQALSGVDLQSQRGSFLHNGFVEPAAGLTSGKIGTSLTQQERRALYGSLLALGVRIGSVSIPVQLAWPLVTILQTEPLLQALLGAVWEIRLDSLRHLAASIAGASEKSEDDVAANDETEDSSLAGSRSLTGRILESRRASSRHRMGATPDSDDASTLR